MNRFIKLGYHEAEAKWISHLLKFKRLDNGHTHDSALYTKTIVNSIIHNKNWDRNHVHLNYPIVLDAFLLKGCGHLGMNLLSYDFSDPEEFKWLEEIRELDQSMIRPLDLKYLVRISNKPKMLI
jgi:hypothetical protein